MRGRLASDDATAAPMNGQWALMRIDVTQLLVAVTWLELNSRH
jgi:hypothetical protein